MSTAVEVRLVPALDPLPREELPAGLPSTGADEREHPRPAAGRLPPRVGPRDGSPRATVAQGRPAQPEAPPGPCRPTVERLGAGNVATYSHAPSAGPGAPAVPAPRSGTGTGGSPSLDPRQACCMIALAAVEVLAGTRPLAQLARWVTPEVYDALARRATLTAPRTRVLDPTAAPADLRDGEAAQVRRPSVRRVRACAVGPHSLEASVVVAHAGRVRAVAVRLTRSTGRWRASALVVG